MTQSIINKIREYFSTIPVEKAWVFGSYSRGEENVNSDIDLMVKYVAGFRPGIFGICKIIESLENSLGIKVDLVEQGSLYPRIEKEVEATKIQIYERTT